MEAFNNPAYLSDLSAAAASFPGWQSFKDKTILISGASGMIGSTLVDMLMKKNREDGLGCRVLALGRSESRARVRFAAYWDDTLFQFISHDINTPLDLTEKADYVVHLASNTHPVAYATEPVATIMTNIVGLRNMLEYAVRCPGSRFAFASSNEVYGRSRGDVELFDEKYCGYIDSNTLRAGYPESKRCGEALCQAYASQYGLDVVIPRFTRSFGPTLLQSDTKALSQFLRNAVAGEDIVLKSKGDQYFSYTYVTDAVTGLLYILSYGDSGEAYNIADESFDITLRDLAQAIADICGTRLVFELPSETEARGFSTATVARLDSTKLRALGWKVTMTLDTALRHTIDALHEI